MDVQFAGDLDRLEMYFEDGLATLEIGFVDGDLPVETAGTQQRGVEYVGTVGGCQHDDAAVTAKTIHLHEQLVQGAFAFVIAHDGILTAGAADGVDLVDEDDTGSLLPGLLEQIAYAAGAYPDKEFNEVGATHGKERNLRFARHGFGQERLTGPRRTDQQRTLGDLSAEGGIFLGIFQKVYDLHYFHLGLIEARYIAEGDRHLCSLVKEGGLGLADIEDPSRTAGAGLPAHFPHQHHPDEDDDQQREEEIQQRAKPFAFLLGIDRNLLVGMGGEIFPQYLLIVLYVGDPEFELGAILAHSAGPGVLLAVFGIKGLVETVLLYIHPDQVLVGDEIDLFYITLGQHGLAKIQFIRRVRIG